MRYLLALPIVISFAQVVAASPTAPNVIDEKMAEACTFKGVVNSVRMGTSATKALNGALEGAMQKATKIGANAIIIKNSTPQGAFMTVLASAYACPSTSPVG